MSRRTDLARIHALAAELDLSELAYRNIIAALTGERSAGDLDETGRKEVIAFLAETRTLARRAPAPREVVTDAEALEILG